jgi:hypothetical protein
MTPEATRDDAGSSKMHLRIAVAAFLAAVTSCVGALDVSPTGIGGNYVLISVDAASLPFHTATGLTLRGAIDLKSDGHYALTQTDSATTGSVTAFSATGHWNLQDNALTLIDDVGGVLQLAVVAADSVKLDINAHHNIYLRQ